MRPGVGIVLIGQNQRGVAGLHGVAEGAVVEQL